MEYLIGIDVGTSGTKTALFSSDGRKIASKTVEYPLYQPFNGWAEQDPEDWKNAAFAGIRAVLSGIDPAAVKGIGLSGQMHGLVMLDADGRVLRRSIIWCDQRTGAECDEMTRVIGRDKLMEITMAPALTGFTASKILWVRNNEPELYEKCRSILLPKDYLRYCLTGELATEVSDASGTQLLDIKNRCWSEELLRRLKIDKALLPKVYESADITGCISTAAAGETGLSPKTPVVGGAGDNAAAAVGTGVVRDGRAFTTIGTSGVVFAHCSKPLADPQGRIHTFCSAVRGEWHVMGVTQAAGLSLKWFRDNFCEPEIEQAKAQGKDPYYIMDQLAKSRPIGSNRLLYLPYLMGERTPHLDPDIRGSFVGLSAMHQKSDLIRAVMEGVTYSLNDCLRIFSGAGVTVDSMMACGGGGSSPLWRKMLADVFQMPVSVCESNEGGALGVALLAGVGAGIYGTVQDACDAVIHTRETCLPDEQAAADYRKYYELYTTLYAALRDSCRALAKLS